MADDQSDFFWTFATPLLDASGVEKGTMMGFPCLRQQGVYVASCEPSSGDLVVKLPADRVRELIDGSTGEVFAPAGRPFREWVKISRRDAALWRELLDEALEFARPPGLSGGGA